MEKVLIGLGLEDAEKLLKEEILRINSEHVICDDLILHKDRKHILQKIKDNNPTVIILRESLKGNDDIIQTIHYIKTYFDVRIIFIAKNRNPGDKLLATLVSYNIYDIIAGSEIKISEIAKLVEKPNTMRNVIHLLPKPSDDNYDEILFESEEKDQEDIKEEARERNPFGIINKGRANKNEDVIIDEEVEDDDLDIENIFNSAKPSKTKKIIDKPVKKKLFGKDLNQYIDEMDNLDKEIEKSKTEKLLGKRKKADIEVEVDEEEIAIQKKAGENLDKQLEELKKELERDINKLETEKLDEEDGVIRKKIEEIQLELETIREIEKQREKERKQREKEADRDRREELKLVKDKEKIKELKEKIEAQIEAEKIKEEKKEKRHQRKIEKMRVKNERKRVKNEGKYKTRGSRITRLWYKIEDLVAGIIFALVVIILAYLFLKNQDIIFAYFQKLINFLKQIKI